MISLGEPNPRKLAAAWAEVDPDPVTRKESDALVLDESDELAKRFGSHLKFGTAGLRGALGAGPMRMNQVLVRVVAAALADRISTEAGEVDPHVVVGYDARYKSHDFATDTARVMAARGVRCTILPAAMPTPVLAFAVKHLEASAGVMVTASHNPRLDNGYKVYWRGGAQIAAPIDAEITERIAAMPLLSDGDLASMDDQAIATADDSLLAAYLAAVTGLLDPSLPRTTSVAYTPIHGVGAATFRAAFALAGFPEPAIVASQAKPDPEFPGVPFPNPEEPGVLDELLALADDAHADVALANDPDADRLAVAVSSGASWRLLSGDELGCLIADYLLTRPRQEGSSENQRRRLVINTVVSSRLLAKIAEQHDADYAEALTGFKWIMATRDTFADHEFLLGYEEALGYAIGDVVRDKDGITAALVVAEMVSASQLEAHSLQGRLDDLHRLHGVHLSGQRAVRFEPASRFSPPSRSHAMAALREDPPTTIGGREVRSTRDLMEAEGGLPASDTLIFEVDEGRVVVRPSGTEPKLKVYGEVMLPPADDLGGSRIEAHRMLGELLDDAATIAASPERRRFKPLHDSDEQARLERKAADLMRRPHVDDRRSDDLRLIVRCLDLTTLEGDDTAGRIRALCAAARRPDPANSSVGPTAAVCVYPSLVPIAKSTLVGTPIRVASVVGSFPAGLSPLSVRLADVRAAIDQGADEVDVVLNRSAFLDGEIGVVAAELRSFKEAAGDAVLKVILEVCELEQPGAIREATRLAIGCGADFVKTSTGKSSAGATPMAVVVIAEEIAAHAQRTGSMVGIKIAGGVHTAEEALGYVAIVRSIVGPYWMGPHLFRFGASSLMREMVAELNAAQQTS